ncbi:putative transposase, Ptta/En/Spm, plant [Helianthus annuus]|nr:putative transposase, Ptta/En/Spm, plant [Helianthus annuus]
MARTMGRGSVPAGGRGFGQDDGQAGGRGVGRGSSQGSGVAGNQGTWRCGGRVYMRGGGQTNNRVVGRRSGIGNSQSSGQVGDRGVGQGGVQYGVRGVGDADDESDFHVMNSPTESSADDDDSAIHVATTRRGSASHVQVPEPINREWIWVVDGEFSNQGTATRVILSNLISLWSGPWESWRHVPNEHKTRLFERFQWEDKWNARIHRCWEKCIAGKFPNLLRNVRNDAKATAKEKGKNVGEDMTDLIDFKPAWIRSEIWKQMLDHWNTPKWKAKSLRNKEIRGRATGGKHTLGSQSYASMKRKAAKILGRELSVHEAWKQSRCRKGSRPLDKDLSCSSSLLLDVDSEGNTQEENIVWVDDRAEETWVKYDGFLVEKYGKERIKHPKFDEDLWSRAAGMNKGKVYGLGNVSDPCVHNREDPEIEKLNLVIKELVKTNDEEKERLDGIIATLLAEKEKDKADKDALLERMSQIEAMLTATVRK